ncbi:phosphatidylglycerophosphatase A [Patescibacteria group bacterium]|nr:phosphatidylglycerophosphatase A [Patescibacteria group bacterium]MBU0963694.1 phosphatidylglycerophosphatase A [Patescibacteria group bacterium]
MKKVIEKISIILATGFGSGYLPLGPGSWGAALMAVGCWWLLDLPLIWYLIIIIGFFFLGTGVSSIADRHLFKKTGQLHDNNQIVIDEWVGMMVTLLPLFFFERTLLNVIIGFLMFRIFDTVKFGLAKIADQWQNRWGVMLDDLFAGVYSAVFLFIVLWIMRSVG